MKHDIDFREYVNMESAAFKGKSSEEIQFLLNASTIDHIYRMYALDRLEMMAEKFLTRLGKGTWQISG